MAYVTTTRAAPRFQGAQVIWYILDVIEVLLAFRFIMRLLGANSGATFTQIIYGITQPLIAPFQAVFGSSQIVGTTFEWTTLLAMIVYWLIAWALIRLLFVGTGPSVVERDPHIRHREVIDEDTGDRTVIVDREV